MGIELSSIMSSPTRRCLDTVAGVAAAHDLPVLARSELAIGDTQLAKDLVAALLADDLDVLICTHGENVLPILRAYSTARDLGEEVGLEGLGVDTQRTAMVESWPPTRRTPNSCAPTRRAEAETKVRRVIGCYGSRYETPPIDAETRIPSGRVPQ